MVVKYDKSDAKNNSDDGDDDHDIDNNNNYSWKSNYHNEPMVVMMNIILKIIFIRNKNIYIYNEKIIKIPKKQNNK